LPQGRCPGSGLDRFAAISLLFLVATSDQAAITATMPSPHVVGQHSLQFDVSLHIRIEYMGHIPSRSASDKYDKFVTSTVLTSCF
jgi:hypothetical protein